MQVSSRSAAVGILIQLAPVRGQQPGSRFGPNSTASTDPGLNSAKFGQFRPGSGSALLGRPEIAAYGRSGGVAKRGRPERPCLDDTSRGEKIDVRCWPLFAQHRPSSGMCVCVEAAAARSELGDDRPHLHNLLYRVRKARSRRRPKADLRRTSKGFWGALACTFCQWRLRPHAEHRPSTQRKRCSTNFGPASSRRGRTCGGVEQIWARIGPGLGQVRPSLGCARPILGRLNRRWSGCWWVRPKLGLPRPHRPVSPNLGRAVAKVVRAWRVTSSVCALFKGSGWWKQLACWAL